MSLPLKKESSYGAFTALTPTRAPTVVTFHEVAAAVGAELTGKLGPSWGAVKPPIVQVKLGKRDY